MRVTVLMGGDSDEREVSLASGAQVAQALRDAGHEVLAVDTLRGVLSAGEERALREGGIRPAPTSRLPVSTDAAAITTQDSVAGADMVFPALHGGQGEDGTLQALFELAAVPYVGSDMLGCALAMDKDVSKRLFRDGGIPTPDWMVDPESATEVLERLELPLVVKPLDGGSSVHLSLARDADGLRSAIEAVRGSGYRMMVERAIVGREFTVAIVGDEALPVGEIIAEHELFDYACKYEPGMAREIFPADIDETLARTLREQAFRVHRLLGLRDFSRVDFMVDEEGNPWCLEANALPGLTSNSLLPRAARAAGMDFPELCDRIVRIAMSRHS